jgi:hypothetical protein
MRDHVVGGIRSDAAVRTPTLRWPTSWSGRRHTGGWAAWRPGGPRLIVHGEFALLHERLNARRPEPLRDGSAAIEFTVPARG